MEIFLPDSRSQDLDIVLQDDTYIALCQCLETDTWLEMK